MSNLFNYTEGTGYDKRTNVPKLLSHIAIGIVGLFLVLPLLFGTWTTIDEGERGIVLRNGQVVRLMNPGFNVKMPYIEHVVKASVRKQLVEREFAAASADKQDVTTIAALNYMLVPEQLGKLYADAGTSYEAIIILPAYEHAIKVATAKYSAGELLNNRQAVADEVKRILLEKMQGQNIIITDVNILNFKFSEAFSQSIEATVTAEQNALKAEQDLARVEFEAQQRIEQATAEAEAIRIQAQAITQQGGRDYVMLKWIEAWQAGGSKVPQIMSGENGGNFILNVPPIGQ